MEISVIMIRQQGKNRSENAYKSLINHVKWACKWQQKINNTTDVFLFQTFGIDNHYISQLNCIISSKDISGTGSLQ